MLKRILPAALIGYLFLIIVNWGCTKLDTTNLGTDLIPAIDNVHTFSDTFDIQTTQGIFNDSFKITRSVNNVLGVISGDDLIGQTTAHMYFMMKPSFYPFYWGFGGDSLYNPVDSMVLCLNYAGFWGDSTTNQELEVFPIIDERFADSAREAHTISYEPQALGPRIGAASVDIRKVDDIIRTRKDSATNQIRIKLDQNWAQDLFDGDTAADMPDNFYRSDSLFRKKFNGFAVKAVSGNALMYINLADTRTRLEVHYRKKRTTTNVIDTASTYIYVTANNGVIAASATSNYVKRDWSSNITSPLAQHLYLVTGPGTYANLTVPSLDTFKLTNRVIHRAEIYFEQEPETSASGIIDDSLFSPPTYMYLDLKDTGTTQKWKPLYYDLNSSVPYNPDATAFHYPGYVEYTYFGGTPRVKTNQIGQRVNYYKLNVSRYLQQMVTDKTPNYTFRLFPAYSFVYSQYSGAVINNYDNPLAYGRIRIKSGAYTDPTKRMKMNMVVIWSKVD